MGFFDFLKKNDDVMDWSQSTPANNAIDPTSGQTANVPQSAPGDPGHMIVEDVFTIKGRGTVATGKINGTVRVGDRVAIIKPDGGVIASSVIGVETFRKSLESATDAQCGLLLADLERSDIDRGDTLQVVNE